MTTPEFSNEFDILFNNISSNSSPGIDEYEKSVFLTKAQKQMVRYYFEAMLNKTNKGFDQSEKRQYDFSSLIKNQELTCLDELSSKHFGNPMIKDMDKFDNRSFSYISPVDLFLTINEQLTDVSGRVYTVLPINYIEYNRLMSKPYGYPIKRQAWRLNTSRQDLYNGLGYARKDRYFFVFKNVYYKPLNIIISPKSEATEPTIVEYSNSVTINLSPKESDMVTYWNMYLVSSEKLKSWGGDKYLYPLEGNAQGSWPSAWPEGTSSIEVLCPPGTLENNISPSTPIFEIIGRFNLDNSKTYPTYNIRYVKVPKPIILVDLDTVNEGLSIDGYNTVTECSLPEEMHEEILQRAVELAKAAYTGNLQDQIALGTVSGTEMGVATSNNR